MELRRHARHRAAERRGCGRAAAIDTSNRRCRDRRSAARRRHVVRAGHRVQGRAVVVRYGFTRYAAIPADLRSPARPNWCTVTGDAPRSALSPPILALPSIGALTEAEE